VKENHRAVREREPRRGAENKREEGAGCDNESRMQAKARRLRARSTDKRKMRKTRSEPEGVEILKNGLRRSRSGLKTGHNNSRRRQANWEKGGPRGKTAPKMGRNTFKIQRKT